MKTLRYLITIAAILLMAFAWLPNAEAQSYNLPMTELNGGTNNVAKATTNATLNVIMTATRSDAIAIQPIFKLDTNGTEVVVFSFDHSIDGANWQSAATTLSITANGTNTVTGITNVTLGAVGFVRLRSIENPNTDGAITNLVLRYATKTGL